jgi:hypothetical protein
MVHAVLGRSDSSAEAADARAKTAAAMKLMHIAMVSFDFIDISS